MYDTRSLSKTCNFTTDEGIWDFKAWLKPTQGKMENHSKYHAFKFTKDFHLR